MSEPENFVLMTHGRALEVGKAQRRLICFVVNRAECNGSLA